MFVIFFFKPKFTQKIHPKELNWTNLTINGPELPRWVNVLGRTSLQVHSRSSSRYDWSTCSELYPEAETTQPGQRGTTRIHRHRKSTHTLGNGDTTQQPARDSEGELAAAAAAPPPPPPQPPLLLLLCCCCCCCCCCCHIRVPLRVPKKICYASRCQSIFPFFYTRLLVFFGDLMNFKKWC